MKWGVIQFPGSCDERDALAACARTGDARLRAADFAARGMRLDFTYR